MPEETSVEAMVDAALAKLREQMLRELSEGPAMDGTLDQIEEAVARLGAEFRRRLQQQIIAERTRTPRENTLPCPCGGRARYHLTRERILITRHGELRLARPYYHCPACHHGFAPLDATLGLDTETTTTRLRCWRGRSSWWRWMRALSCTDRKSPKINSYRWRSAPTRLNTWPRGI